MSKLGANWKWIVISLRVFWATLGSSKCPSLPYSLDYALINLKQQTRLYRMQDWMAQNLCMSLFLYFYMLMMLFYSHIILKFGWYAALDVLGTFCQIRGLTINGDKTKMMAIKAIHQDTTPQVVQSFKYLDINVPWTMWVTCYEYRLQVGRNSYYMFMNQCNQMIFEDGKWEWCSVSLVHKYITKVKNMTHHRLPNMLGT